jgi:hypothetical protein
VKVSLSGRAVVPISVTAAIFCTPPLLQH